MFESFVIMLREGIEAALVIGITLVVLKRSARRDLERAVYGGLGLAIVASVGAAVALSALAISEEIYEGVLYWVSAVFVASMMWWMHRKAKSLHAEIEQRVQHAVETAGSAKEAWGLGAFAFLMVFREGAEAVMFLSAVNLTTDALLTQRELAQRITEAEGDYLLPVKDNQPSLRADLAEAFSPLAANRR